MIRKARTFTSLLVATLLFGRLARLIIALLSCVVLVGNYMGEIVREAPTSWLVR